MVILTFGRAVVGADGLIWGVKPNDSKIFGLDNSKREATLTKMWKTQWSRFDV